MSGGGGTGVCGCHVAGSVEGRLLGLVSKGVAATVMDDDPGEEGTNPSDLTELCGG
jgi:hypothetical protein